MEESICRIELEIDDKVFIAKVQTDMGGYEATLTVKESAESIKKFTLSDKFPNGKFLRHGEELAW